MQSSNPVFSRSDGFNGRGSSQRHDLPRYDGPRSTARSTPVRRPAVRRRHRRRPATTAPARPMTIDSVVQKTGITLGVVVLVGRRDVVPDRADRQPAGARARSTCSRWSVRWAASRWRWSNSFKKIVSPALVLAYAAVEGVFVGAFSKAMEAQFGSPATGGLVMGAVVGTFAAVAGTLAAYKFFNIQVGEKFRKRAVAAMFGFVAVSLFDFVLSFFSAEIGINGFGALGLVMSFVGLGLGMLMLILDFDFVERGIAAGLPERESWRAAFGLTVTIIWIYIELLRILAILRGSD